ncbi:hypothetical protein RL74_24670 [Pseudomonas fluorescens]|uniref:Uncharacterized protein n=1 Tax=Pseudomonas fluorescens TaxID=294 RepID=A0A0D0P7K2_PSEFL|nr:hypothetical protein RL74_24670 [Pseudomonas fluorescens]
MKRWPTGAHVAVVGLTSDQGQLPITGTHRRDRTYLDSTGLSIRQVLLALAGTDRGAAHAPVLRARGGLGDLLSRTTLAAQTEQTVLSGGQGETRKAQWVHLLLGAIRWQLTVKPHDRRTGMDLQHRLLFPTN